MEDVGDAETAADFDGFGAGDDDLASGGEGGEAEEDGGGVVVDGEGGFGAGELLEEGFQLGVASAALAGVEVVFEVGVAVGGLVGGLGGGAAEGGAAEVGVNDYAGGVDYGAGLGVGGLVDAAADLGGDLVQSVGGGALSDALAGGVEFGADQFDYPRAAVGGCTRNR